MSSKSPTTEDAEMLESRINEAAKFTSLDNLAIGPQCGFASSIMGNPLTEDAQKDKLARLVEVAEDVWGGF